MKPDKVIYAIDNYIKVRLGNTFINYQQETFETIFQDIDNFTPLLFILSEGVDPMPKL